VTFYEEMLTLEFMKSMGDKCFPIKAAPAVAQAGYYPTKSCIRGAKGKDEYTVSMEGLELRQAGRGK
jgi:hypothetical protein